MTPSETLPLPLTADDFAVVTGVSKETLGRLRAMDEVFMDWAGRHNLVARSTLPERWTRHYYDSWQLVPLLPEGITSLVDLGSGAGFPGLVLALMLEPSGVQVTLVESTQKKCAFLRAAGEAMGLTNLEVLPVRIEALNLRNKPDIITARALARLDKLLAYGAGIQRKNTKYFFLKGQDVEVELTEATKSWHMDIIRHASRTSPESTILEIGNVKRAHKRD